MQSTLLATLRMAFVAALGASFIGLSPLAHAQPTQSQNPDAVKVLAEMGKATVITQGKGPRVLNVFIDANCPYCHELFIALQGKAGKDGLQVRWVPVAVLAPSSVTKGAAILQAKDRLAALRDNELNYGKGPTGQGGGITPATHVLPATSAILNANNALLDATRSPGVPTLLYRDKQGQAMLVVGPPDAQQLKDILASVK
ncbi:thioredoxin fold domain-containing protein [Thiomonas bhubaneswarensis]|uniref:Thioredoxin-like domain n=1 Tax=Thiomonas bhubaneswarensis TaxID=339866 RepID=A0A0K6HU04_9BURK|nr:thioredoxin fold domain-containing protein [Thiomonas bhubaneswarensis]CUA94507.1 Thioredoxin-like domain [Thiomonas bhubaneswarensis]